MVWAAAQNKPVRRSFQTLSAARAWRAQAQADLRRGRLSAPSERRLTQAAEEWLALARRGVVRTRSGTPYKASALRGYCRR
jgi:integrase